jgi:hypothetical protein
VLAQLQASSRFVFALARDNAMPFADTIKWTNSSKQPVVANWVVVGLCIPFCLLTIAGKGTLYSVLTVTAASLSFVGYVSGLALACATELTVDHTGDAVPPVRPEPAGGEPELVEPAPIQVGPCYLKLPSRAHDSKPCACLGIMYGSAIIITQMLPNRHPVTASTWDRAPLDRR